MKRALSPDSSGLKEYLLVHLPLILMLLSVSGAAI